MRRLEPLLHRAAPARACRPSRLGRASLLFAATLGATWWGGHDARGQTSAVGEPSSQNAAEALFEEAQRLFAGGDVAKACTTYEASRRLDPAPGTLLNLARCYETEGKTASAWLTYRAAVVASRRLGRDEWISLGERRAQRLDAAVPRVTFRTTETGLSVEENGVALDRSAWGVPIPIDPGTLVIDARAEGRLPWHREIVVAAGDHLDLPIGPLDPAPAPPVTGAPSNSALPATPADSAVKPRATTRRSLGIAAIAVSAAAAAGGTALGVLALVKADDARADCPVRTNCPTTAATLAASRAGSTATGAGNLATGLFVAAGALGATGTVLLLTLPKRESASAGGVLLGAGSIGWRQPF